MYIDDEDKYENVCDDNDDFNDDDDDNDHVLGTWLPSSG